MRFLVFLFCVLTSFALFGQEVAKVTHLSGVLSVRRAGGETLFLSANSSVMKGDVLTTEANAFARIRFLDNAEVVLRPQTQMVVNDYRYEEKKPESDRSSISMLKGSLRTASGLIGKRNHEKVELNTPVATIGIRGTVYEIMVCEALCVQKMDIAAGLYVYTIEGAILIENPNGGLEIPAGVTGYVASPTATPRQVENQTRLWSVLPKSMGSESNSNTTTSMGVQDGASATSAGGMGSCSVR